MKTRTLILLSGLGLAVALAVQQAQIHSLKQQLASAQRAVAAPTERPAPPAITEPGETVVQRVPMDPAVYERLLSLEETVGRLNDATEHLMERGQVPLAGEKLAETLARLNDPAASSRDRFNALRLLRRNGQLDDTGIYAALNWLNGSTNGGLRDEILRNLEGMTNASLQAPLMQLALGDPDLNVREQAVDNLGRFVSDPAVEAQLWSIMENDADAKVREEAAAALRRTELSPARVASLQNRILDSAAGMEERLLALQALRGNETALPHVMSSLAQEAQNARDPQVRARWFSAFNGLNDPALKVPLVYGLQDPNPVVRQRAADALSGFRSDPQVREWLEWIARNDTDPAVQREAFRAMGDRRR